MPRRKLIGKRTKADLRRRARARLGLSGGSLQSLCMAVASSLGETWTPRPPHHKRDGYRLLARFLGELMEPEAQKSASLGIDPVSDDFLQSYEWRRLRMRVLVARGARCECCGFTAKDGVKIHVDHIKPRRRFPDLALTESNLQILCEVCNHGKGNWDETDWRGGPPDVPCWTKRVQ